VKARKSSEDAGFSRIPNFCLLYGRDCRCLSFAPGRMSWRKNSLVPICTKFISTTIRIQRLRPLLSGNDAYIKVKRMVCLLDRSGSK
jgi:hypothetical protein